MMPDPLLKATCPECQAGLKTNNPNGFTIGDALECPKCHTYFAVEGPKTPQAKVAKKAVAVVMDDDDENDESPVEKRPSKKKKSRRDDDQPSGYAKYRKSPIRFVVLGILLVVMIVMAVLLWLKWENQKKADAQVSSVRVTSFPSSRVH